MASTIINASQLSVSDIKFYAPKVTQGGGKNVGMMNKSTHTALRIKLPIMFTFGASDYQDNKQYSCSLQFPDITEETDPIYAACLAKLSEFETALKRKVLEFSKDWLGKALKNEEMVDMIWTPMLKYPKNKETGEVDVSRPPTLNCKIPCYEGKWSSEIYDEERNLLFPSEENPDATPLEFITRGTNMKTVLTCGGLWIVGGKMGVTWKLAQTIVRQQNTSIQGVCHIDMDESEKTVLKRKADLSKHQDSEETVTSEAAPPPVSTEVVDSDEEQETGKEDSPETEDVDEEPTTPSASPATSSATTSPAAALVEPKTKKAKRDTKK
jgi:hypothetical protein